MDDSEVKTGESVDVVVEEGSILQFVQANFGEVKEDTEDESVCLHITFDNKKKKKKKIVVGSLHPKRCPQLQFMLCLNKNFQISHNGKHVSFYCYGTKHNNRR
uniref:Nucleoplasmin-like domain-containing protein n=1 Tax=Lactuca sativa TaxID=4236 RepID=A0A9R1UD05_LACSA|nr:hypothetical protein LSAT_V11C900459580 [Lactuca sativa]